MNVIYGDLIEMAKQGQFDVIVHGCNCYNTMGAGIALAISKQWPQAKLADKVTTPGDISKLGTYTFAVVGPLTIVNAYTQYRYGGQRDNVNYDALERVFLQIGRDFPNAHIGYPLIGAGLAGGDWDEIAHIIDRALDGLNHTLVLYKPD